MDLLQPKSLHTPMACVSTSYAQAHMEAGYTHAGFTPGPAWDPSSQGVHIKDWLMSSALNMNHIRIQSGSGKLGVKNGQHGPPEGTEHRLPEGAEHWPPEGTEHEPPDVEGVQQATAGS